MNAQEIQAAVTSGFEPISAPDLSTVVIADDYTRFAGGPAGVRAAHARAALADAVAIQAFRGDGTQHVLVARRVGVARPFTQLLEIHLRGDDLALCAAWREYEVDGSPLELFARLVERYGAPVTVGGLVTDNFVARLTVPQFDGSPAQLIQPHTAGPNSDHYAACTMRAEGGNISIEWTYAFDMGAYTTATARAARKS